jgi:hypothetical protein
MKNRRPRESYPDYGEKEYAEVLGDWCRERGVGEERAAEVVATYRQKSVRGLQLAAKYLREARKEIRG